MKTTLFAALLITLFSCGKNDPPTGKPSPIIGGNSFIEEITTASLTNGRTLTQSEAKTIMTDNFDAITKVEVGMKWRETSQALFMTSQNDDSKYCYQKTETETEILEILPVGTAQNIEGDAIKVESNTKITFIEGNDCSGDIGTTESFGPNTYEMENHTTTMSPEEEVQGFDQFDSIQVGTYNNRQAMKASITFDGTQYHALDYFDNPSIVGAFMVHHTQTHNGKTFINASKREVLE